MLDIVKILDIKLFYIINHNWRNSFLDIIMPFITNTKNFYLLFLAIFLGMLLFGNYKTRITAVSLCVGITLSDLFSSKLLKHIFNRPRPFEVLENVIKMVPSAGPSFPSSHAMNSFTVATMLFLFFKKSSKAKKNIIEILKSYWVGIIAYLFATLSAISRVYVGVHYPSDIICGAVLGIFLGYMFYKLTKKIFV